MVEYQGGCYRVEPTTPAMLQMVPETRTEVVGKRTVTVITLAPSERRKRLPGRIRKRGRQRNYGGLDCCHSTVLERPKPKKKSALRRLKKEKRAL